MRSRIVPDEELREQIIAVASSVLVGRSVPADARQQLQEIRRRAAGHDSVAMHAAQAVDGLCLRLEVLSEVPLPRSAWDKLIRWLALVRSDLELERHVFWSMGRYSVYALASFVSLALSLRSAVVEGSWVSFGVQWLVFGLIWQELPLTGNDREPDRVRYLPFRDREQWQRYAQLLAGGDVPSYEEHRRSHRKTLRQFRTSHRARLKQIVLLPGILVWRSLPQRKVVWLAEEPSVG